MHMIGKKNLACRSQSSKAKHIYIILFSSCAIVSVFWSSKFLSLLVMQLSTNGVAKSSNRIYDETILKKTSNWLYFNTINYKSTSVV